MATASDILRRSMRLLGALGDGEEPTASEGVDGLAALNAMLDAWWAKSLAVYYTKDEAFTWTGAQASQTMGTGGDFNTTRPSAILGAYQRDSSVDYPIEIITRSQYDQYADKTVQSTQIARIYPEMQASLVYLYAYPVPSAAVSIHILSSGRLQSFAGLSTAVALPPGYERALAFNLAVELAPEYSLNPSAVVVRNAALSLRAIKRNNVNITPLVTEVGLIHNRRFGYDYNVGE